MYHCTTITYNTIFNIYHLFYLFIVLKKLIWEYYTSSNNGFVRQCNLRRLVHNNRSLVIALYRCVGLLLIWWSLTVRVGWLTSLYNRSSRIRPIRPRYTEHTAHLSSALHVGRTLAVGFAKASQTRLVYRFNFFRCKTVNNL